MRVVPVNAWVRKRQPVRECAADRNRGLRRERAVVAVVEPQAVPMHRRLQVALVDDIDQECGPLLHTKSWARDGSVVGQHSDRCIADCLLYRLDAKIELGAVGQRDHACRLGFRQI
jgi:hypothetical protein